jgi:3D (Asp-Asp-Asp) domain-containing protein
VIPLGTEVRIGGRVFVAEDTGVQGKSIDIFMESHAACLRAGVQYSEIFIKKEDIK